MLLKIIVFFNDLVKEKAVFNIHFLVISEYFLQLLYVLGLKSEV